MPNTITNYGTEVCGTLTRRHDSSPCKDGGLGLERECAPTLAARPSALEPTICHSLRIAKPYETYIGQIGTTERLGNAFWREVAYTLQTAGGDASPTIIQQKIAEGRAK